MTDREALTQLVGSALFRWAWISGYGAALATCIGLLGGRFWILDLFANFRAHYTALLMFAVLILTLRRCRFGVIVPALALVVNLYMLVPLYLSPAIVSHRATPAPLRNDAGQRATTIEVLLYNLHWNNQERARTLDYLTASAESNGMDTGDNDTGQGPDIVALIEIDPAWIEPVAARFPGYRLVDAGRSGGFAMAVLARPPVKHARIIDHAGTGLPAAELVLTRDGRDIAVLVVHPPPPIKPLFAHMRDRMITALGDWAAEHGELAVVVGDLNATPWSYPLRTLLARGALVNSQRGFGIQATWPGSLWPLAIPIDHVLHTPALTVLDRRVGPFIGSDHRPLHVTLAMP